MISRVYTAGGFAALEEALAAEVGEASHRDPLPGIDLLAGSNLLCTYLRRFLARRLGGILDVGTLTIADLVRLVEERAGLAAPETLPPQTPRVLVDEMLREGVPEDLAALPCTAGFGEALLATFTDLSEGGCTGETVRRALAGRERIQAGRVRSVLELFARYRDLIGRAGGDLHERIERAVPEAAGAMKGRRLYVYGFYDFNEMQWRMIRAAAAGADTVFFVPWDGSEALNFAAPLVDLLRRDGARIIEARPSAGQARAELVSAPDPREEAREIARRLIESAGNGSARFGSSAVLTFGEGQSALVRDACEEAGIPWYSPAPGPVRGGTAVRGIIDLLRLLCGDGGRAELADFLGSAQLAPQGRSSVDPFAFWIRAGAVEGMTGEDGWENETRRLIEKYERAVRQEIADPRYPDALRDCAQVITVIEQTRSRLERCVSWSSFADVTGKAAAALFGAVEGAAETAARLEALGGLDAISAGTTLQRFAAAAAELLEEQTAAPRPFGAGAVSILPARQSRGMRFGSVFLPGLTEGAVPGPVRQDPFLKDSERSGIERAAGAGARLSRRSERLDEIRLIFALSCRSARERLVCSWPRIDGGTGREYVPSSYLVHPSLRPGGGPGPERRRLPLGGRPEGEEIPLSRADYDHIHAGRRRGRRVYVPPSVFFERGARCLRERLGASRFTSFDGIFESAAAVRALDELLAERGWSFSATALEAYVRCPFAFYIGKILGIEQVEEPERAVTLTPLRRGSAVHLVMERLYRALGEGGILPLSPGTLDRALDLSSEVAPRALDEFAASEPVGRGLFWEIERRRIGEDVGRFIREEAEEGTEYLPVLFEERFGGDGSAGPVAVDAGGRTVFFHGRIDRVDRSPQGRYRVVDYKTGSLRQKDQDFGGGADLQLPVYLLAASAILGLPVERGEAVYRRVGGDGKRTVRFSGDSWDADGPRFSRIIETIVAGVSGGSFFALPGGGGCEYCGARQACPTGSRRLFDRKSAADARANGLLALREADDE